MTDSAARDPRSENDLVRRDVDRQKLARGSALLERVARPPADIHEYIVDVLGSFFKAWAHPRGSRFAMVSGYRYRVREIHGPTPELKVYRAGSLAVRARGGTNSDRPDLVVEVVAEGSTRFEQSTKRGYYAWLGVPEYWTVDPRECRLDRLSLSGDHYVVDATHGGDEVFRPDLFRGLEIPLSVLWTMPRASDA